MNDDSETFTPQAILLDNRRRATRYLCQRVCYARPNGTSAGILWGVTIYDISTGGVGVIVKNELPIGAVLQLQPTRSGAETIYARVVRVQTHEEGFYYGCQFLEPMSEDDLQQWLACM